MTKYDYRQFLGCLYLWQLQMCGETPYRALNVENGIGLCRQAETT